jgi:hypothetical protein
MPRLLRILWLDAYAENEWCFDQPEIQPQRCVTVGYLMAESDSYLLLAATLGLGDHQSNARFAIPKGCILERQDLGGLPA